MEIEFNQPLEVIKFEGLKPDDVIMLPVLTAGNEGFISNVGKSFEGFLNRTVNTILHLGSEIKELGSSSVVKEVREATSYATLNKINYNIKHINYVNHRKLLLPVPTSLKTPFHKHVEHLNDISEDFFEGFDKIFEDAIDFLSSVNNDRDFRTSVRIKLPASLMSLSSKTKLVTDIVKKDYGSDNIQTQQLQVFVPNMTGLLSVRDNLESPISLFSVNKIFKSNDNIIKIRNIADAIALQAENGEFNTNGKAYKLIVALVGELAEFTTAAGLLLHDISNSSRAFVHSVDILRDKV